jgi:hypothetical protein
MKRKKAVKIVTGLIAVAVGLLAITVIAKRIDATAGVINFPFYQGTRTMDATREMILAMGWEHRSESGRRERICTFGCGHGVKISNKDYVTFEAADQNGKVVTFKFIYNLVGTKVVVSTEEAFQYSVEDITKELARRIGMRISGDPLPEAKSITSRTTGTG